MYFRASYVVHDLRLEPISNNELRFYFGGAKKAEVVIRFPKVSDYKIGGKKPEINCVATFKRDVRVRICAMFRSLEELKLPDGSRLSRNQDYIIDKDGRIKDISFVPLSVFPNEFQAFAKRVQKYLSNLTENTIRMIIWRSAADAPHEPLSYLPMEWSFDGVSWREFPSMAIDHVEARVGDPFPRAYSEIRDDVVSMVNEKVALPIGHELFREAWQNMGRNMRSSLVIGMAATEASFKQFLAEIIPETQWLVENVSMPSVIKMIKSYLPKLPTKNKVSEKVIPVPNKITNLLKKGMGKRHKIVHVGSVDLSVMELRDILLAVRDLLWILDYYRGYDWAWQNVRQEIRQEMEMQAKG